MVAGLLEAAPVTLSKKIGEECVSIHVKKKKKPTEDEAFLAEKIVNSPMTYWPGSASTCDHPPQKKKTKWNLEAKSVEWQKQWSREDTWKK